MTVDDAQVLPSEMLWSGWGDPAAATPLPADARALVDAVLGTSATPPVAEADVVLSEPLPEALVAGLAAIVGDTQVATDHHSRLVHTRGKSTNDLLRIRRGDGSDAPGAVVRPADADQVQAVLDWCVREHVALVPFGGGTSVVGGLVADRDGYAGVVALDLARLDRLVEVDAESRTAVLEAGVRGPDAERLLGEHGLTLGHFPQSFEFATIGGFAVTRSSGQASAGFGRFDAMVVGLQVATPAGPLDLGSAPSDAAGPDLRQWVLGSEGAFGIVTAVRLRVRPLADEVRHETWRFPDFAAGRDAMRAVAQSGLLPTVLRLSDETETALNLADPSAIGAGGSGCLLVLVHEGSGPAVAARREVTAGLLAEAGGVPGEETQGRAWADGRFRGPYLRDALLDTGVLVETLETVSFWSRLPAVYAGVRAALEESLGGPDQPVLVLCHVSHVYETGASLYFTVATRAAADPVAQWSAAKAAATRAMVDHGASVTHHHAVGRDHLPWLGDQVGPVGLRMLAAVKEALDPTGVLNPGVLVGR